MIIVTSDNGTEISLPAGFTPEQTIQHCIVLTLAADEMNKIAVRDLGAERYSAVLTVNVDGCIGRITKGGIVA